MLTDGKRLGIIAIAVVFATALVLIWAAQSQIAPSFARISHVQAARSSVIAILDNLLDQDASVRSYAAGRRITDRRAYLNDRRVFDGMLQKAGADVAGIPGTSATNAFNDLLSTYRVWLTGVARPIIYGRSSAATAARRQRGDAYMRTMRADIVAVLADAGVAGASETKRATYLTAAAAFTAVFVAVGLTILALLAERRRETLESERKQFVEAVDDLVAVANYDGYFLWMNRAWQRVLGHAPREMASRQFTDYVHPEDRGSTAYEMLRLARNEPVRGFRNRYRAKDGSYHWLSWNAVPDPRRRLIYVAARDETDQIRAESQLAQLSYIDHLTGLPNRRHFIQELNRAINAGHRHQLSFWLLYLDLDGFKDINDKKGHAAGDDALRGVVANISSRLRESDLFARVGGDEFGILTPPITLPRDAEAMAQKIVDAASAQIDVGGERMTVGISVGIAGFPDDGDTADELLAAADSAMYAAKRSGGCSFARYGAYLRESPSAHPGI